MDCTPREHQRLVREIFSTIHGRYDLLNHLLSLGFDIWWRRAAIPHLPLPPEGTLLDLACGTADMLLLAARAYPGVKMVGVDVSGEMLALGKRKLARHRPFLSPLLLQADALALPFADDRFDAVTIAFGIRNITPWDAVLREMVRVCKQGGHILILEMHYPSPGGMRWLFRAYTGTIFPVISTLMSRHPHAYDYLIHSIIHFPDPPTFGRMMMTAGLIHVHSRPLPPGITYLHVGMKPGGQA